MKRSRREALLLGLTAGGVGAFAGEAAALPGAAKQPKTPGPKTWRRGVEGQRRADLGDGSFLNPVLSGDRPDPNILKDGEDYYATYSSFLYYPGVVIWHSRDLVNWSPLQAALKTPIGSVWALDIAKHGNRYFIYIPVMVPPAERGRGAPFKIYVIHAPSMRGPWSEPIDMGIDGYIDPGHIVGEDGRRYLFLNDGHRVRISDDGLRREGEVEKVYDGWAIPEAWIIEGFALEGPKLIRRGEWFYMFSGQGGTAGPPTSHMVVVARSKSINGPWENCPHNPIVRTAHRSETWWSRGHATPVQGPKGDWWMSYHGYENGMRTLGRQMLLEPFDWTADGWPRALGGALESALAKPVPGSRDPHGVALSGPLGASGLGVQYAVYDPQAGYLQRLGFDGGTLRLKGQGASPGDSSPITLTTGDLSYEVMVKVEVEGAGQAGLLLFYNDKLYCGLGLESGKLHIYKLGQEQVYPPSPSITGSGMFMRVTNDRDVVTFAFSYDAKSWHKAVSFEVSGYNHNVGDGFLSLRPALFASGEATGRFTDLTYAANLS